MRINDSKFIPKDLFRKFEFYSYNHALEILGESFPEEWSEIVDCLEKMEITVDDVKASGGNKSEIAKKFDRLMMDEFDGWEETRITADLSIRLIAREKRRDTGRLLQNYTIKGYIDGHNIDFLKGRVALDLEWNSKDQTFDRDLLAMRTYYDCGVISVGAIITRAEELNDVFKTIYYKDSGKWKPLIGKYGASTTWMGKLLPRLDSRRNGGCPILAIGIKKNCITDWSGSYVDENDPRHHHQ